MFDLIGVAIGGLVVYAVFKAIFSSKNKETYEIPTEISFERAGFSKLKRTEPENKKLSSNFESFWVSPGKTADVKEFKIPNGMVYVGGGLSAVGQTGYYCSEEPALIDPGKRIIKGKLTFRESSLGYWPSYEELQPSERAAYLQWLAEGKKAPDADIGYVFLYFYGLERRILHDTNSSETAQREVPLLIKEIKRLLSIYGDNYSFKNYAFRLISHTDAFASETEKFYERIPPLIGIAYLTPLWIRIALAQLIVDKKPIPSQWALTWLYAHEETRLRTPAHRCKKEFEALFKIKYKDKYGEGILIKPNKTKLRVGYRPASPTFHHNGYVYEGDLPDVFRLSAPSRKFQKIADECMDELDTYSRYLGRNESEKGSFTSISLLPEALISRVKSKKLDSFKHWVTEKLNSNEHACTELSKLLEQTQFTDNGNLTKKKSVELAQFLEKLGFGLEPDNRFGGQLAKAKNIVIYKTPNGSPASPSDEYMFAVLMLKLGVIVSNADGVISEEEKLLLEQQLEHSFPLTEGEKSRLRAHLTWLLADQPDMKGLKKALSKLPDTQKTIIGKFVAAAAAADGVIAPEEVKSIKKIYSMIGINESQLYSELHGATSEPVTVRPKGEKVEGYGIPDQPGPKGVSLDKEKINKILKETAVVSNILKDVFVADVEEEPPAPPTHDQTAVISGLDERATLLLKRLGTKDLWKREELEVIADEFDLMLDGALENINGAAYDKCDEPLFEDDDPLEINKLVFEELLK